MIYLLFFFMELPPPLRLEECLLSTTFNMVSVKRGLSEGDFFVIVKSLRTFG